VDASSSEDVQAFMKEHEITVLVRISVFGLKEVLFGRANPKTQQSQQRPVMISESLCLRSLVNSGQEN
jgi:hypothetical protein